MIRSPALGHVAAAWLALAHGRNSITVRPIRIGVPTGTAVGATTRVRSR
jgi:hypothetical protein